MDPLIGSAIISGLSGFLGGRRAEKREAKAIAAMNEYNKPINIRARAEEAGMNPLLFVGPGVGQQTAVGGTNYMGQAIADAGMMLGDAFANSGRATTAAQLNQYQTENQKLREQVQSLTLRPDVDGIYARHERAPTRGEALGRDPYGSSSVSGGGRADSASASLSGAGLPDLLTVDPADPRREVEQKPVPTGPGVMVVDNPYAGRYYFPTIDGDEPIDLLDLPSMAIGLPQAGYNFGDRLTYGGGRESRPNDKFWVEHYKPRAKPKPRPKWLGLKGPTSYSGAWVQ